MAGGTLWGAENAIGNRRAGIAAWVVLALGLMLVGAFVVRVFSFYRQLQMDGTVSALPSFATSRMPQERLSQLLTLAAGENKTLTAPENPVAGDAQAPVTLVAFMDFGCPYSRESNDLLHAIARQFPSDVRMVARQFPIEELHPDATRAAHASLCAQEQGQYWEYHDALFRGQPEFTDEGFIDVAAQLGLRTDRFRTCLEDAAVEARVMSDLAAGINLGVTGTPTLFVNGVKLEGAPPYTLLVELIREVIR